jgi:hypothetical protein
LSLTPSLGQLEVAPSEHHHEQVGICSRLNPPGGSPGSCGKRDSYRTRFGAGTAKRDDPTVFGNRSGMRKQKGRVQSTRTQLATKMHKNS